MIFLFAFSLFANDLVVELTNSSKKWPTYVQVYQSNDGFPTEAPKALLTHKMEAGQTKASIPVKNPGVYAISIYQDTNGNKRLDTNWIGIPREPVGVSNNAKGSFGPPRFEDCKFEYKPESTLVLQIQLSEI